MQRQKQETKDLQLPDSPTKKVKAKLCLQDFHCIQNLGQGAFGEVLHVRKKENDQEYALKVVDKNFLAREKKQYQVYMERGVLMNLNHVGLIKLNFSFQDQSNLYFGLDLVDGGDFAQYLKLNYTRLEKEVIQFYMAELVSILEYLHQNGIAHRDIKPENIMMTSQGHLKLIDFGTAMIFDSQTCPKKLWESAQESQKSKKLNQRQLENDEEDFRQRASTFVGTAEYVAPELLEDDISGPSVDIWALGIVLYKIYAGKTPFHDQNEYLVFNRIKDGNFEVPKKMDDDALDLIQKLLTRDPNGRIGVKDFQLLKNHEFFKDVNWLNLFNSEPPQKRKIFSPNIKKKAINNDPEYYIFLAQDKGKPVIEVEGEQMQKINIMSNKKGQEETKVLNTLNSEQSDICSSNSPYYNQKTDIIRQFQLDDSQILFQGMIKRKVGNFILNIYQINFLQLYAKPPRLLGLDPEQQNKIIYEIDLNTPGLTLKKKENDKFVLEFQKKKFQFKQIEKNIDTWILNVQQIISSLTILQND